jgi:hypothetical protein
MMRGAGGGWPYAGTRWTMPRLLVPSFDGLVYGLPMITCTVLAGATTR